ncbi:bifunctional cystathionine gamma-lyase/homocysteine desulfhydrase [Thermoanaerobacterium sp. DL9XJH110]|uniref:bifunctional cystathionine gamma-lyase/homocysteine desulfhydrase n=1 Tax=Thermoanaerobacterium sp. DL9XJH110 TaxID=3386643 RepID=UPI003BB759D8
MRPDTKLLHTGFETDEKTGAVSYPIYQVSTYRQEAPGKHLGYEYSRTGNPSREALEKVIASLEEGKRGFAFASGMAAITAVFMLFSKGDHVIVSDDVYGGTYRVLSKVFDRMGIEAAYVDTTDLTSIKKAIKSNTRAVFIETPTNPLLKITDIRAVAELCDTHSLLLLVDNTFMTPYWQKPLSLGADIVIHSATKYLGGHSDVVAGLAAVKDEDLGEKLHFIQNSTGGVLGPFDSWLLMRGIKTLGLRMQRHEQNANELAGFLTTLPQVKKVYYPGLPEHPGHEIQKRQAGGFGGMISFELASEELAEKMLRKLKIITLAESLGAVESLISLPARMTHASIPEEERKARGISNSLVRLSVGIEDVRDLKDDILTALS